MREADVLKKFTHNGYTCKVVHNGMGFRCGYVTVPPEHPAVTLHNEDCYALENAIDVHGGVTYVHTEKDGSLTIGFDCAHYNDAPDPRLKPANPLAMHMTGIIRTTEYCVKQCIDMADQLQLMEDESK